MDGVGMQNSVFHDILVLRRYKDIASLQVFSTATRDMARIVFYTQHKVKRFLQNLQKKSLNNLEKHEIAGTMSIVPAILCFFRLYSAREQLLFCHDLDFHECILGKSLDGHG